MLGSVTISVYYLSVEGDLPVMDLTSLGSLKSLSYTNNISMTLQNLGNANGNGRFGKIFELSTICLQPQLCSSKTTVVILYLLSSQYYNFQNICGTLIGFSSY